MELYSILIGSGYLFYDEVAMYYPRHLENVVVRMAKRKPVVVLTGARQVGKSTMLKETFGDISYISLTNPLIRESAKENPSMFFKLHKTPLVVDEIQKAGQLFDYIKEIVDENKKYGSFYLTGSQSLSLMNNVSESLAGRAGIVKMLGISMRELRLIKNREPFIPCSSFLTLAEKEGNYFDVNATIENIHKGFFPELHEVESDLKDWNDFYSSYFQTYIEKDVKDILRIQDESSFIKFVRACASMTGQMLSLKKIGEITGKDSKTIKSWLSVLESCGLIYLLEPFYENLNKRMIKTPKLYFLDTGLACWLLGWNTPTQLVNGAAWGNIFETFVITEILKSYYNDGIIKAPLYYYRDIDKKEIDLIIEVGNTLYPIEIKTSSDPHKAMVNNFQQLKKISKKQIGEGALICLADKRIPLVENVWTVPANLL